MKMEKKNMTTKEKLDIIGKAAAMSTHKKEKAAKKLMGKPFNTIVVVVIILCFAGMFGGVLMWIWAGSLGWKIALSSLVILCVTYLVYKIYKTVMIEFIDNYIK